MARKQGADTPSDEEILAYNNVPVYAAALYIGCAPVTLRNALKQGKAPFGYAVENPEQASWSFQISPGALVNFKAGKLQSADEKNLVERISAEVEKLLALRSKAALEVFAPELLSKG